MVKIVTGGAIMCCTLGTGQAKLTVLSQSFRSISGAFVATEEDKIGLDNSPILEFANVVLRILLVFPIHKQGWQQTTKKDCINGMKKLTEQSFCMCAKGGRISFVDTGSNTGF